MTFFPRSSLRISRQLAAISHPSSSTPPPYISLLSAASYCIPPTPEPSCTRLFSSSRPSHRTPAEVEAHRLAVLEERRKRFEKFELTQSSNEPFPASLRPKKKTNEAAPSDLDSASSSSSNPSPYSRLSSTEPSSSFQPEEAPEAHEPAFELPPSDTASSYRDTFSAADYEALSQLRETSRKAISTSLIPPNLPVQSPLPKTKGLTPSPHPIPFSSFLLLPPVVELLQQGFVPLLSGLGKPDGYPQSRNIVKFLTPDEFAAAEKAQRDLVSGKKKASVGGRKAIVGKNSGLRNDGVPKELFITWVSSSNDLAHKAKQTKDFLEKGWRMRLEFSKRRKGGNRDPVLPKGQKEEAMSEFLELLSPAGEKSQEFEWADGQNKAWMMVDPVKEIRERLKQEDRKRMSEPVKSKAELKEEARLARQEKKQAAKNAESS